MLGSTRMQKNFLDGIRLKATIHRKGKRPYFHEGEIWWCSLGANIGAPPKRNEVCITIRTDTSKSFKPSFFLKFDLSTQNACTGN